MSARGCPKKNAPRCESVGSVTAFGVQLPTKNTKVIDFVFPSWRLSCHFCVWLILPWVYYSYRPAHHLLACGDPERVKDVVVWGREKTFFRSVNTEKIAGATKPVTTCCDVSCDVTIALSNRSRTGTIPRFERRLFVILDWDLVILCPSPNQSKTTQLTSYRHLFTTTKYHRI